MLIVVPCHLEANLFDQCQSQGLVIVDPVEGGVYLCKLKQYFYAIFHLRWELICCDNNKNMDFAIRIEVNWLPYIH